jgi:paraquat-inducible protein B
MALDMSAEGVRIEMASMTTLLSGGVTFDVLDGWPMGARAENNTKFQLFENKKSIQDGLYNEYLEYLMFFEESVRGLTVGAPVEYHGVRIGTVAAVPFFLKTKNPLQLAFNRGIPVLVRIESGRLYGSLTLPQLQQEIDLAVSQGLTASLKTGNLLTGGLYIELDHLKATTASPEPVAKPQAFSEGSVAVATAMVVDEIPEFGGYKILPTTRSGLGHIEQKVLQALDKINNLPVEQVLADSSATLNETQRLMVQSQQLLKNIDAIVQQDATKALPAEVQQSLAQLRATLAGVSPGSPAYERINSNLQAMDKVLRDLQPVVNTLNQQSNALILGADPKADPEPAQGTEQ